MKKIIVLMMAMMATMSVNAQYLNDPKTPFTQGKYYVSAAASGLDLNYSKSSEWSLNLEAKAGLLFLDNWMVLGVFDYNNVSNGSLVTTDLGLGARFYIEQNGIYLGAIAKYAHSTGFNDFQPEAHIGYAFFLNRHVTLEPEVYYKHSFKDNDYSGFGLRIGFGYFF